MGEGGKRRGEAEESLPQSYLFTYMYISPHLRYLMQVKAGGKKINKSDSAEMGPSHVGLLQFPRFEWREVGFGSQTQGAWWW